MMKKDDRMPADAGAGADRRLRVGRRLPLDLLLGAATPATKRPSRPSRAFKAATGIDVQGTYSAWSGWGRQDEPVFRL